MPLIMQEPRLDQADVIRFTTRNSEYTFTWISGQPYGTLLSERGTYAGKVMALPVEPFRDLAWPGEIVEILDGGNVGGILFRSTRITSVDRGH